jgi:GNAT superfamily N-acetyltransferase
LLETQIPASAEVLGRAFFDDPMFTFVFPDEEDRRSRIGWVMSLGVRYGHRFGHVFTTTEEVRGNAVWLPPGGTSLSEDRMGEIGFGEGPARMGEEAFARFGQVMGHIAPKHEHHMPEAHWYLMILGVDPPLQGRGIGGRLIQPILGEADRDGLPCYLETAKSRNVPFYEKHGFAVVEETDAPDAGPHMWLMRREPRRR